MKSSKIVILLSISFLISCNKEKQKDVELTKKNIVVIGSSTAAGIGLKTGESWVDKLDSVYNDSMKIINLAQSGYTTYQAMPNNYVVKNRPFPDTLRNISKAIKYNPYILIINLPTNDIANGFTEDEYLKNLDSLYNISILNVPKVFITTSQPRNISLEGRNTLKKIKFKILSIYKDNSINFWDSIASSDGNIKTIFDQGDGIHLNASAHKILYLRVHETLKSKK